MFKKVLFVGFLLLFLSFCMPLVLFAQDSAKIIYIEGSVLVMKQGTNIWLDAKVGQLLNDGDKVKTPDNSYTEVALDKTLKNIIKIDSLSEVTITNLKPKEINLSGGKVLSLLEKLEPGSKFEVKTPTAVAGVSGSGISVETDGSSSIVGAFEDRAYVQGIDAQGNRMQAVDIDEGYKRIVERFHMPGDLILLTDLERQQWSSWRQSLREHIERSKEAGTEGAAGEIGGLQESQQQSQQEMQERAFQTREFQKKEEGEEPSPGTQGPY